MSGSLHKKKNANAKQKQNSNRLSNSKIIQSYSSHAPAAKVAEFFHHQSTGEDKNNPRKAAKIKPNRKHQLSVQYILQNKFKQPYSMRSVQIFEKEKDKAKIKKKRREGQNNESNHFVVPVLEFSRSNSLIVFSQKDSTINGNANREKKNFFVAKPFTLAQAAVIIQKNWRGYLTRKLLQQYINEEETKLVSAMNFLKSKQESFVQEKHQEMDFSDFSEIKESNHHNERQITEKSEIQGKSSFKRYQIVTTEHQSQRKQYTYSTKRFFGTKTQSDLQSSKKNLTNLVNDKKSNLCLQSSVISQKIMKTPKKQEAQCGKQQNLEQKINQLKYFMSEEFKSYKCNLKLKIENNKISMHQMLARNNKIKQVYQNSQQFLTNVLQQLQAMLVDMQQTVQLGIDSNFQDQTGVKFQPKSQVFTFQAEDSEPEAPSTNFLTEGHLKMQSYLSDLLQDYQSNYKQISELQYLCQILKINSERGIKTMIERCLLQFTVQIITSNYPLVLLNKVVAKHQFGETQEDHFVAKWINQLNKWEMGPIQEVTQAMQSSSLINQSTTTIN